MDVLRSRMIAARVFACARLQSRDSEENKSDTVKTAPRAQAKTPKFPQVLRNLMASTSNEKTNPANSSNQPDPQVRLGSCETARRRVGRTQRGQDPLSYKVGPLSFHTFRAMDPDKGCQCVPSQLPRCPRTCRKVLEMRKENYTNSLLLQSLPEDDRRKVFGDRDPTTVLVSRAYKYNARFITEKTKSGQGHIFDEMERLDSIIPKIKELRR